jgi:hypothetical protein
LELKILRAGHEKISTLTICLLGTLAGDLSARFTEAEISQEVDEFQLIARRAKDMVTPIRDQIQAEKERISIPMNAEIEPLRLEIEEIRNRIHALYAEIDRRKELNKIAAIKLEAEKKACTQEALAPMEAELASRRAPILGRVAELVAERDAIEREHYRLKADPVWGRWMDGIDSLDAGLRIGLKDRYKRTICQCRWRFT